MPRRPKIITHSKAKRESGKRQIARNTLKRLVFIADADMISSDETDATLAKYQSYNSKIKQTLAA